MSEHEHQHDENCNHEEESHNDQILNTKKGEKAFVKFAKRFHMSQLKGITRIIIKTQKGFTMYIDNPTIMTSDGSEDSYVVFGQMQYFLGEQNKTK